MTYQAMTSIKSAYIEAIYFTGGGSDNPDFDDADISDELNAEITSDIETFLALSEGVETNDALLDQIGHDLWLTRNGHGTGFWDRPEIYGSHSAKRLTDISEKMGESCVYIGDDGLLYS